MLDRLQFFDGATKGGAVGWMVALVALVLSLVRFSDLPYVVTTGGAHQPSSFHCFGQFLAVELC